MSASSSASTPTSARAGLVAPGQADRAPAATPNRAFRSLQYGFGLLALFTPERPVWGITEAARELHVDRATAHRYATTCLELGWLEQLLSREYRLTRRCAEPAMAMLGALQLTGAARPILRELRRQTARTVSLAVLDGEQVLYLQRLRGFARGQYQLEQGLGAGSRLPARDTAAGRALLSEIEARPPESDGEPLSQIGQGRLTVNEQDARAGARGLAVTVPGPVPGEKEGTCAIEITVPAESIGAAELVEELGEPLLTARVALEVALSATLDDDVEERVA
jgi:IclR family pca regulon transcriptional regulator